MNPPSRTFLLIPRAVVPAIPGCSREKLGALLCAPARVWDRFGLGWFRIADGRRPKIS